MVKWCCWIVWFECWLLPAKISSLAKIKLECEELTGERNLKAQAKFFTHAEHVIDLDWQDAAKHALPGLFHPCLHPSLSLFLSPTGWAESCYSMLVMHRVFSGVIWPPTDCRNPYQFELILIRRLCMLCVFQVCCRTAVLETYTSCSRPRLMSNWPCTNTGQEEQTYSVSCCFLLGCLSSTIWPGLNYCWMYALKIEEENPQGSS